MNEKFDYDLIVIGSGPGGQKAAVQAAKLGKRVALIDLNPMVGGVCLHDGTIPSKSFREAIMHLSGYRVRSHFGQAYRVKLNITMDDLVHWSGAIVSDIEQTLRSQLQRNNVEILCGMGSFIDEHHVKVCLDNKEETISGEFIVIATGTRPRRPDDFEFDNGSILDSNGILYLKELPKDIAIVGGGVIGCEYGSMFATLGIKVTIVEAREQVLGFLDKEIVDTLTYDLRERRVTIITNDKVVKCARANDGRAVMYLESGKRIVSQVLLVSAGRIGNVEKLQLENTGIAVTDRSLIEVNDYYQTSVPHIYAVGDVKGFPALASTSMEEGRRAACHAFGLVEDIPRNVQPFGIFTIPEISIVGKTEVELSKDRVPYETGISRFSELERGKIVGETHGFLKILFHRETLEILGVHIIGEGATELIHIGQVAIGTGSSLNCLVHMIFNYPTMAQAYKVAALDGINKVIAVRDISDEELFE